MTAFPFPAGTLVVSCQAQRSSPLHGPGPMSLMARAAVGGGADGIRANGPADIAAIRAAIALPIIGINKMGEPDGVFITPTLAAAVEVVAAGADVVAIDGTTRPRPDGRTLRQQIAGIHRRFDVPVMTDVDTLEAGLRARDAGADAVATTLSGYTSGIPVPDEPDITLVLALAQQLDCPVVAEGRYWTAATVRAAFDAGACTVVVGTAITNPVAITQRLVRDIGSLSMARSG
jgi:putative N-acetylmannosamine-6-phosphate epimerase